MDEWNASKNYGEVKQLLAIAAEFIKKHPKKVKILPSRKVFSEVMD
jgi:hypothetical protein